MTETREEIKSITTKLSSTTNKELNKKIILLNDDILRKTQDIKLINSKLNKCTTKLSYKKTMNQQLKKQIIELNEDILSKKQR